MAEDKYYYITHPMSERQPPQVMKWNENYTLEVEENVDWRQCIDLTANKLNQKDMSKPVNNKYTKVKPVIKEIFYSHYTLLSSLFTKQI